MLTLAGSTPPYESTYYSIGGVFIERDDQRREAGDRFPILPFSTGAELLEIREREALSISDVMWRNETALRQPDDVRNGLIHIWRGQYSLPSSCPN
jgi:L-serine dehydratase